MSAVDNVNQCATAVSSDMLVGSPVGLSVRETEGLSDHRRELSEAGSRVVVVSGQEDLMIVGSALMASFVVRAARENVVERDLRRPTRPDRTGGDVDELAGRIAYEGDGRYRFSRGNGTS